MVLNLLSKGEQAPLNFFANNETFSLLRGKQMITFLCAIGKAIINAVNVR